MQASWVLTGALDWARLILREDARSGGADYLSEPWAVPLAESRLSTFLAADHGAAQVDDGEDAFLSGQITDLQSRLNITNLINNGALSPPDLQAFTRLFELLGLPRAELQALAQNLLTANLPGSGNNNALLLPVHMNDLLNLGLSPGTIALLRSQVTILPERTALNLNTASAEAIYASIDGVDMAQAQKIVAARQNSHFNAITDAQALLGSQTAPLSITQFSVGTRYFEVVGRLRLGETVVQERSLVLRDGLNSLQTLWRERVPGTNTLQ